MNPAIDLQEFRNLKERNRRVVKARRPRRKATFVFPGDVIELTDSDDERPSPRPSQTPQAGPSNHLKSHVQPKQPLFLPDPDEPLPMAEGHAAALGPQLSLATVPPPSERGTPALNEPDMIDLYVVQVLEIIPDVDPAHVSALILEYMETHRDNMVEAVLHNLFENPDYPKAKKDKGKRKREADDDGSESGPARTKVKIDYASKNRQRLGGQHYDGLALDQLCSDFPFAPKAHVKRMFVQYGSFYAPTYLAMHAERQSGQLSYTPLASSSRKKSKGKKVARVDVELEKEKEWVQARLQEEAEKEDAEVAAQLNEQEYEAMGDGIECGCCFSTYSFDKMIQCPEAHLFCTDCMSSYAATKLGEHNDNIVCMDQSGCKLRFPDSELRRFLSEKLLELYNRVKQRKEIEAAGLENLEECPFCEYKVVIDNDHEKLFRCEREECGAVSCRACKRLDHLPKSCKEVDEDRRLDGRHAVEEAMTRALLRNCPKCNKAFVKEHGCNKMTCPNCHTLSCYICRQVIKGYDHFNQQPGVPQSSASKNSTKCPLWDAVEKRHADDVIAAAKRAKEEYRRDHPDAEEKDLEVELPEPVAGPANPLARLPHAMVNGIPVLAGAGPVLIPAGGHNIHNGFGGIGGLPHVPPPAPLPRLLVPPPLQMPLLPPRHAVPPPGAIRGARALQGRLDAARMQDYQAPIAALGLLNPPQPHPLHFHHHHYHHHHNPHPNPQPNPPNPPPPVVAPPRARTRASARQR